MSQWFDRLAKTTAVGASRRDALKYLGGLLAGGFLAALPGRARADDDNNGGSDNNGDEINETCQAYCKSCVGVKGGAHGTCIEACKKTLRANPKAVPCGQCSAMTTFVACTGAASCCGAATAAQYCTNLSTDVTNCGACGNNCFNVAGASILMGCCPDSSGKGVCTDLTTNATCGSCTTACTGTQKCKCTTTNGVTTCACA